MSAFARPSGAVGRRRREPTAARITQTFASFIGVFTSIFLLVFTAHLLGCPSPLPLWRPGEGGRATPSAHLRGPAHHPSCPLPAPPSARVLGCPAPPFPPPRQRPSSSPISLWLSHPSTPLPPLAPVPLFLLPTTPTPAVILPAPPRVSLRVYRHTHTAPLS